MSRYHEGLQKSLELSGNSNKIDDQEKITKLYSSLQAKYPSSVAVKVTSILIF